MKQLGFLSILLTILFLTVSVYASNNNNLYSDLNTKNIKNKFDLETLKNIKMLCSYEYCDYTDMDSIDKALYYFTKGYLETIKDDETKNILKVKGITITKVIFAN